MKCKSCENYSNKLNYCKCMNDYPNVDLDIECDYYCKEQTAQEMFEKLGYEKNMLGDIEITYSKEEINNEYGFTINKFMNFDIQLKKYNFSMILKAPYAEVIDLVPNVSMEELNAINQQCKELG